MRTTHLFTFPLLLATAVFAQDKAKPAAAKVDFQKEILPILEKRCVDCHQTAHTGLDGKMKKPKGGVVLDNKEGMFASKKGKLLVAKKPDDSMLYKSITLAADHEDRMPPAKKGEPLSKEQQDLIKKWIEEGADVGTWVGKKAGEAGGKEGDKPKTDTPPAGEGEGKKKKG
ncbi:MAG: hypothetical protein JNK15_18760 [Planctomycetes bacterium]|nr:hypothetical protein [Planctomycetota bacterium]